jgi:hypothetical protein
MRRPVLFRRSVQVLQEHECTETGGVFPDGKKRGMMSEEQSNRDQYPIT